MCDENALCRVKTYAPAIEATPTKFLRGFETYTTDNNVRYQLGGLTSVTWNGPGLRVPARAAYLGPNYFDSGCLAPYTNNRTECPECVLSVPSPTEKRLFDEAFASYEPFDTNHIPKQCMGVKDSGYNSSRGWTVNPSDCKLRWQSSCLDASL